MTMLVLIVTVLRLGLIKTSNYSFQKFFKFLSIIPKIVPNLPLQIRANVLQEKQYRTYNTKHTIYYLNSYLNVQ